MSLSSRPEVGFDAQVDLERSTLEPTASTLSKIGGLWCFGDAKQPMVERTRLGFAARRHGEQNVIDCCDWHDLFEYPMEASAALPVTAG
jgi:hypothetical protein